MNRLQDNLSRSSGGQHRIAAPHKNHVQPPLFVRNSVIAGFMRCTIYMYHDLCQAFMGVLRGSMIPNTAAIATTLRVELSKNNAGIVTSSKVTVLDHIDYSATCSRSFAARFRR